MKYISIIYKSIIDDKINKYINTYFDLLNDKRKFIDDLIKDNYKGEYLKDGIKEHENDLSKLKPLINYDYIINGFEGIYINENIMGIVKYLSLKSRSKTDEDITEALRKRIAQDSGLQFENQQAYARLQLGSVDKPLQEIQEILDVSGGTVDANPRLYIGRPPEKEINNLKLAIKNKMKEFVKNASGDGMQAIKDKYNSSDDVASLPNDVIELLKHQKKLAAEKRITIQKIPITDKTIEDRIGDMKELTDTRKRLELYQEILKKFKALPEGRKLLFDKYAFEKNFKQMNTNYRPDKIFRFDDPLITTIFKPYIEETSDRPSYISDFKIFYLFGNYGGELSGLNDLKCTNQNDLLITTTDFIETISG